MQGFDRKKAETLQEKLLTEVLHACMEEQISFIPPEREIARTHTFSEQFRTYMEELLQTKGKPQQKKITKKEFVYRFNKIAAVVLIVFVVGGLSAGAFLLLQPKGVIESAPAEAPASAADEMEVALEEAEMEEAVMEEAGHTFPEEVSFMGNMIPLATTQKLESEAENVSIRMDITVVPRDAQKVMLTVENGNDYPLYGYEVMELEVLIDEAWYFVPGKQEPDEETQHDMWMLPEGMAQEKELALENYALDYEAEKYRIVLYLDGAILGADFRFEE